MKTGKSFHPWLASLVTICLIPCLVGCDTMHEYTLTGMMWDSDMGENHHEPMTDPCLKLSQTKDGQDVLVEYQELYEGNGHIRHRAFLLFQNEKRLDANKKPRFVSESKANKLRASPIQTFSVTDELPTPQPLRYAVISTYGNGFTIVTDGYAGDPYRLPVYLDPRGTIVEVALTPVTATCDVVIYTVIIGSIVGLYALANGWHP